MDFHREHATGWPPAGRAPTGPRGTDPLCRETAPERKQPATLG